MLKLKELEGKQAARMVENYNKTVVGLISLLIWPVLGNQTGICLIPDGLLGKKQPNWPDGLIKNQEILNGASVFMLAFKVLENYKNRDGIADWLFFTNQKQKQGNCLRFLS